MRWSPTVSLRFSIGQVVDRITLRSANMHPLRAFPSFSSSTSSLPQDSNLLLSNKSNMLTKPPIPPIAPPSWNFSPTDLASQTRASIAMTTSLLDSIVSLQKEDRTFKNVVRPIGFREGEQVQETNPLTFLQNVDPRKEMREASIQADKEVQVGCQWPFQAVVKLIDRFWQELNLAVRTRKDVYQALLDAKEHTALNGIKLAAEEELLMDRLISDMVRSGMALSSEDREIFVSVRFKSDCLLQRDILTPFTDPERN